MSTIFLIFRVICYLALAVLTLGVVGMLVLSSPEFCSSFSTGAISCKSEGLEELARLTMGILLASVFTGVPVLLAFTGLIFALRAVAPAITRSYRKAGANSDAPGEQPARGKLGRAGRIIAYLIGAFFISAIIAGIYEASFQ